jgi:hypothetical protein
VPNYIVVNRDQPNEDVETFIEDEDWIELNGKRVHKPFVEKPVDGKVRLFAGNGLTLSASKSFAIATRSDAGL